MVVLWDSVEETNKFTAIEGLREWLRQSILRVTFRKKTTGEIREMVCTSSPIITEMPENKPKGVGNGSENHYEMVTTFALDRNGWRTFHAENVLKIELLNEATEVNINDYIVEV